jgi:hypothetical protein
MCHYPAQLLILVYSVFWDEEIAFRWLVKNHPDKVDLDEMKEALQLLMINGKKDAHDYYYARIRNNFYSLDIQY